MATGESWPKAHRRPSREDAMADAECAEWKEGGSRWFGAAAMSCCCGAADYGLWKGWRQMFSPTAIRCPVLRLTPDGLSVAMPWWRRVVDSDPMLRRHRAKKEKWSLSRQGARQHQAGPGAHHEFAPTPEHQGHGPMAGHNLHVSGQGQGPGTGCGTTQCESLGWGCDNDAGVGGPSTLPVCRPSIVVVAQEIVDSTLRIPNCCVDRPRAH